MDKAAPRRSLPIQKKKITNDRKDGEPESVGKRVSGTSRKSLDGEESSDVHSEIMNAQKLMDRTSPEPCTIQQLPKEVLAMIFSYCKSIPCYFGWGLRDLRLVCKDWYDVYVNYTDANVYFNQTVPSAVHFGNCGFRKLRVRFYMVDLDELPLSMWKKIGCKIRSLKLEYCKVGNRGLKNLIMHCCNMQSLKVLMLDYGKWFCSPNMLTKLHITRKNLKTFKIFSEQKFVDVSIWIEIFEVLFEVYPNVINYAAGHGADLWSPTPYPAFKCPWLSTAYFEFRFPKQLNGNDKNSIATTLAYSLCGQQRKALDAASTIIRLVDISLHMNYAEEDGKDVATLRKFICNSVNLECIEMELSWINSDTMLENLLRLILQHCCKLRKLKFSVKWQNLGLAETLLLQLRTICPSLEELRVNPFRLTRKHSSSLSFDKYAEITPLLKQFLENAMKNYPDLQHLDLGNSECSDEMLQSVFKHLPNLKTLIVKLGNWNSNAGITGNLISNEDGSNCSSGYSIDRLKNLEKLCLRGYYNSQLDNTILDKLNFPNLRHLEIDLRKDPFELLPILAQSMPSLETIDFENPLNNDWTREISERFWTETMVSFVRQLKKLRMMKLHYSTFNYYERLFPQFEVIPDDNLSTLFLASSSLHYINGHCGTHAHYLRDSNMIMIFDQYRIFPPAYVFTTSEG